MVRATELATAFTSLHGTFDRESCLWNLLRLARARVSLPLGVVRFGAGYWLFSEMGELVGEFVFVSNKPTFGRNEPTVYLRR